MLTVRLFAEPEVQVDLGSICTNLSRLSNALEFIPGSNSFALTDKVLKYPESYSNLSQGVMEETEGDFKAIFVTKKRYDNNYFFHIRRNRLILSFFAWEHLTKLPLNNGLVFFIADILALNIDHSFRHDDDPKPECIYDFGWNKAGVDLSMRSALICPSCMERVKAKSLDDAKAGIFTDLQVILNDLGNASKWETDIVEYWNLHNTTKAVPAHVHRDRVFISYSHNDSEWLRRLKTQFKPFERTAIVQVWDDTQIRSGDDWRQSIANALRTTKVAVLLVSPDFLASDFIANEELPRLLEAARKEGAVIMPIILRPCGFERITSISKFQAVNSPARTLVEMSEGEQDRFLLKLVEDVLGALT